MKTYEETLKSVLNKKADLEKRAEEKRRRISFIAAAVAVIILIASIPIGSVIAAVYVKQTEMSAETAAVTEPLPENVLPYIDSAIITAYPESEWPQRFGFWFEGLRLLTVYDDSESMIPVDGGFLCRVAAGFGHVFTEDQDGYQLDVIVTDGEEEICRETYFNEKSQNGMTAVIADLYLFIPDGCDFGEIHFYLNLLGGESVSVSDYKESPFVEMCACYAQKYRCLFASYGDQAPNVGRERLLQEIDERMHDHIYGSVVRLYELNNNAGIVTTEEKRERMKINYAAALTAYKADHPEEYARIIEEFISNDVKTYDRYGNLIETPTYRHDPLEDVGH